MNLTEPRYEDDPGLDAVVAAAYEAGAGTGAWDDVCGVLADVFGLWGVQILGVVKAHGSPMFAFERGGPPPEARLQYITTYHAINPRIGIASQVPTGAWFHDHEHFDEAFVASHPFFRDFLVPYGGRHMSATKLLESDELVVFLGLHRSVAMAPMSPVEVARFDRIRDHLCRALSLYVAVQRNRPRTFADHALLDVLDQAVLSVDSTRLIGYRNPSAERLLASGGALCERDGFLDALELEGSRTLAAALYALHLALRTPGESLPERRLVRLGPVAGHPEQLLVLVPVQPERSMNAFGETPCAVVLASPLRGDRHLDPLLVSAVFGLTPAEAMVAIAVAQGRSAERIAADRRVTLATIRSQLRIVYEKVDADGQSDLVRRLREVPRFGHPGDVG